MARSTGAKAFVNGLKSFGVTNIFGAGGSSYGPIQDVIIDRPEMNYYLALHEMVNTAMADGFARVTGRPSMAMVHVAVGTVNALGSIFCAYRDHTPMVVLAGDQSTSLLGRKSYNEAPQQLASIVRPFVKSSWQVLRADRILEDLGRAITTASSAPQGPVFLSIPKDLMLEEFEMVVPEATHLQIFSDNKPNDDAIAVAAGLIDSSEYPVIVIGSGVAMSRASKEIIELADRLAAPIFLERNSYVIDFSTDHPLYLGDFSPDHLEVKNTDLLINVGGRTEIQQEPSLYSIVPPSAPVIHINLDPGDIGLVHRVDAGIVADPKQAVQELLKKLHPSSIAKVKARRTRIITNRKAFDQIIDHRIQANWDSSPVKLGRFLKELAGMIDPKKTVLVGHGSGIILVRHVLRPWTIFGQSGPGYLGWVLSASLGIKLGLPDRRVICILGDGNFMFGSQALWTAAKYGIAVTIVILDNRFYLSELTQKNLESNSLLGADIGEPPMDFVKMADSMNVAATRIERPSDLQPALKEAFTTSGPFVIDLMLDRENPNTIVREAIESHKT